MTDAETTTWYQSFKRFAVSRATYWKPKIQKNLNQMITNATSEPDIQTAISKLDHNMMKPSGLGLTLTEVYKDAGRIFGGMSYQHVKKQVPGYKPPTVNRLKRYMPIGYNEQMVAEIVSYLQLHGLNAAEDIKGTMRDWILEQLIQGQEDALSIQQVADNMLASGFPPNRAIVIARTETIKAANVGAVLGAKKTGLLTEKVWISARDTRTRRIPRDEFSHVAMHGKTAAMDEPFKVPNRDGGHDSLMQPGDPSGQAGDIIQCRCTVGFNVVRDAQGLPIRL